LWRSKPLLASSTGRPSLFRNPGTANFHEHAAHANPQNSLLSTQVMRLVNM
jgi:hypothetical protein